MDIDGAIQAHTNWKLRLLNDAGGKAPKLDLERLRKDDTCILGQWLHGEGRQYAGNPTFARSLETHTAFHVAAASLGAEVHSPESEFNRLSFRLVACLADLDKSA